MAQKLTGADSITLTSQTLAPNGAPGAAGILNSLIIPGRYRLAGMFATASNVGTNIAVSIDVDGVQASGSPLTLAVADTVGQVVPVDTADATLPLDLAGGERLDVILDTTGGGAAADLCVTVLLAKLL